MKQKEFKAWLEHKYVDAPAITVNSISNSTNIETHYGDLDMATLPNL